MGINFCFENNFVSIHCSIISFFSFAIEKFGATLIPDFFFFKVTSFFSFQTCKTFIPGDFTFHHNVL